MKVTVSYQYDSVEEAILALGKQAGVAKVRRAAAQPLPDASAQPAAPSPSVPAPAAPGAAPAKRKPGRPRLPKAEATGSTSSLSGSTTAGDATTTTTPVGDAPVTVTTESVASASPTPSIEDAQKAIERYFDRFGVDKAVALLATFGTTAVRHLSAEQRPVFIAAVDKALA